MNFSRTKIFFLLIYMKSFTFPRVCVHAEKSLFDELPMNGAFAPSASSGSISNPHASVVSLSTSKLSPRKSGAVTHASISLHVADDPSIKNEDLQLQLQNSPVRSKKSKPRAPSSSSTTKISSTSLFDQLPNQGALDTDTPSSVTRNTRDSLFSLESGLGFDLRRSKPQSEFDLTFVHNRILPHVVNSLTSKNRVASHNLWSQPQTFPILHHQDLPIFSAQDQFAPPERFNKSYQQVSAKAEGPTVIVYANPDGSRGEKEIRRSTEKSVAKNEIHYHYHINRDEALQRLRNHSHHHGHNHSHGHGHGHNQRPTMAPSSGSGGGGDGGGSGSGHGGWRSSSGSFSTRGRRPNRPNRPGHNHNHQGHNHGHNHQHNHSHGHDHNHQGGGGHNHGHGQGGQNQGQGENHGGWGSGGDGGGNNNGGGGSNNEDNGSEEAGDDQNESEEDGAGDENGGDQNGGSGSENTGGGGGGSSGTANNPSSGGPYPPSGGYTDRRQDGFRTIGNDDPDDEDFLTPRQLFTNKNRRRIKGRAKGQNSGRFTAADSISLTYETPPSQDEPVPPPSYRPPQRQPSSSYGAPPPPPPKPSYGPPPPAGPPAPPPAPPSNDQPQEEDKFQTTISFQTIPITKQVTEFVQVPNIVHHISTSSQSDQPIQEDEPAEEQPHYQEYGPPPNRHHKGRHSQRLRPPPPQRFRNDKRRERPNGFQAHISKLFGSSPGGISSPSPQDNLASILLQGQGRNRGTDLELLELLAASGGRQQLTPILSPLGSANVNGGIFGASRGPHIRQIFPAGVGDSSSSSNVENLREVIREQRYQNILTDLRSRLREETRSGDRARSDYRSLFSKGALLLSALTLLPTMVSPFATATAAAGATSSMTNYMLPLIPATAGRRRRRSLEPLEHSHLDLNEFEKCLQQTTVKVRASEMEWIQCSNSLEHFDQCENNTTKLCPLESKNNEIKFPREELSLIRSELVKYVRVELLLRNSRCVQAALCKTMEEVARLRKDDSTDLLDTYLRSFGDKQMQSNPWIHQVVEAFNRNGCKFFPCSFYISK